MSSHQIIICFVFCLLISISFSQQVTPKTFPLFKQCDTQWGSNVMGSDGDTICQVGCLMSSVSMALNGFNIEINSEASNPGTLNSWLRANNGYVSGSDLDETTIPNINPNKVQWIGRVDSMNRTTVINNLESDKTVIIANVMNGGHFVLVTGYDKSDESYYYVNDPGFERNTYNTTEIVGWRVFDMSSTSLLQYQASDFVTLMKQKLSLRLSEKG